MRTKLKTVYYEIQSDTAHLDAGVARSEKKLAAFGNNGVRINFDADSRQLEGALQRSRLEMSATDRAVEKLTGSFKGLALSAAAYKAAQYAKEAVALGDEYRSLTARLTLVTHGTADLAVVQQRLFQIAQDGRQPLVAVSDLYTRAARSGKDLGASQAQILQFAEGVSNALRVSGTSAVKAEGALLQLSQALGSGKVRAEEFNSVQEGAPRILQAVAAGMGTTGISFSDLRNRVIAGKVTSKEFFDAFLKGSADIKREAATIPETAGGAFIKLQNAVLLYLGTSATMKAGSREISDALTVLAENLDNVARFGVAAGVVFGARFLAGAAGNVGTFASEIAKARAETIATAEAGVKAALVNEAYAEDALRTATANTRLAESEVAVAQARLEEVAATQAAIAAEQEVQTLRLGGANKAIATALGDPNKSTAEALRDADLIVAADKERAAAQRELVTLGAASSAQREREIVELAAAGQAHGAKTAAVVVETEATAALGVVTEATSVAQKKLAATTSLSTRALQAAGTVASRAWALIGGPIGAVLISLYAVYSIVKKIQEDAFARYVDRAASVQRENAKFAKSLDTLSINALRAAQAQERLNLAQAGQRVGATTSALLAEQRVNAPSLSSAGPAQFAAAVAHAEKIKTLTQEQGAAVDALTLAQSNLASINERLAPAQAKANSEIDAATKKYNATAAAAKLELERQRALNDAFGQSEEAIADLNATYDLKAKIAAIDIEYTGKQAAALRAFAIEQAHEEKIARQQSLIAEVNKKFDEEAADAKKKLAEAAKDLAAAQAKEDDARAELIKHHKEAHDAIEQALQDQRDQIKLLGLSGDAAKKFADDLLYAKKFAEFFKDTDQATADRMAKEFVRNARAISDASAKTDEWANGLENIVGIVQLIGATLEQAGNRFGKAITQAANGLQSVVAGAKGLANAGKDSNGNKLSGVAKVASYVGPIGAIVGGILGIADALDLFGNRFKQRQAELRAQAEQWNNSLGLFARDLSQSGLGAFQRAQQQIAIQIGALADELYQTHGSKASPLRQDTSSGLAQQAAEQRKRQAEFEAQGQRDAFAKNFQAANKNFSQRDEASQLAGQLEKLAAAAKLAEENLRKETEAKLGTLKQDVQTRRLAAQGSTEAYDARVLELQQQRELNQVRADFAGIDGLGDFLNDLQDVQKLEAQRAETLRKQAAAQRILDDEIKAFGLEGKAALQALIGSAAEQFVEIKNAVDGLDLSTQSGIDALKLRGQQLLAQFKDDGEITDDEQKILDALFNILNVASDVFDSLAKRVQRSLAKLADDNEILGGDARTQFGRTVAAATGFNGVLDQILGSVDVSSSAGAQALRTKLQDLYVSLWDGGLTDSEAVIRDLIKQLLTSLGTVVDQGKQEVEQQLTEAVAARARFRERSDRTTAVTDATDAQAFANLLTTVPTALSQLFSAFDATNVGSIDAAKARLVELNRTIDGLSDDQALAQFGVTRDELIAGILALDNSLDGLKNTALDAAKAAIDLANAQREFSTSNEDDFLRASGRDQEADINAAKERTRKKLETAAELHVSQPEIDKINATGALEIQNIVKRYAEQAASAAESVARDTVVPSASSSNDARTTLATSQITGASEQLVLRTNDYLATIATIAREQFAFFRQQYSNNTFALRVPALPGPFSTGPTQTSTVAGGVVINFYATIQVAGNLSSKDTTRQLARDMAPLISQEFRRYASDLSALSGGGRS